LENRKYKKPKTYQHPYVSEDPLCCQLEVQDEVFEEVMSLKNLGVQTTRTGALHSEENIKLVKLLDCMPEWHNMAK
jgi:hypothetical protein